MNYDVNPFSVPPKIENPSKKVDQNRDKFIGLKRQLTQPSLNGETSQRRMIAKQTVLKEKSSNLLREKRDMTRNETRTIIKGVRTNRRFELQMKSRNMN